MNLPRRRRRLAGAERGSRVLKIVLHLFRDRMRAAQYAPRGPFPFLEHRHGLAEIVERSVAVLVQRPRVIPDDLALRGCALVVSL